MTPAELQSMMARVTPEQQQNAAGMAGRLVPILPRLMASASKTGSQFVCVKAKSSEEVVKSLEDQTQLGRQILHWDVSPSLSEGCYYVFIEYLKV